jgi:hypothetical protein
MAFERNACLPTAIAMQAGLKRQGIESRVVRYSYARKGVRVGHAVTAYLFPPGKNKLWVYDYEGSTRARAFFSDPFGIANQAELARGRDHKIIFADFLDQ